GTIEFLYPDNRKVLAFLRCYEDEIVLVVANLSRFVQYANLHLSRFRDHVPVELFGLTEFPRIGGEPLFVTLGPRAFYWFQIRRPDRGHDAHVPGGRSRPAAQITRAQWDALVRDGDTAVLAGVLPDYLAGQRWFQGKGRALRSVPVTDLLSGIAPAAPHRIALVDVKYV